MDVAFFTTYPATGYQRWSETHKPSVGVAVGGSCLTSHISFYAIQATNTATSTLINYGTQHNEHLIGCRLANDFIYLWREGGYNVTIIVFNTGNK